MKFSCEKYILQEVLETVLDYLLSGESYVISRSERRRDAVDSYVRIDDDKAGPVSERKVSSVARDRRRNRGRPLLGFVPVNLPTRINC